MVHGRFAAWRPFAPWLLLWAAALASLSLVPPAGARTLHTVLQDDALSLFSPSWLPQYMSKLRWLGVDELRISAEWKLEAPDPNSPTPPPGFRFSDPSAYDSPGTTLLDRAVRAAAGAGLGVIIDPAFSAPRWATTDRSGGFAGASGGAGSSGQPGNGGGGPGDQWYRTNVDIPRLVAWETMLARRYSGHFIPSGARTPLPRVGTFTLWNEPNGPDFLQPQWQGAVPASADWSRELADLAYPAIKRVSPDATVLIGNTSDVGADTPGGRGVAPMDFIRRLACVDAQLRPVHDGSCAHFQTVPADGYAHHPYERDAPPWTPSSGAGQAGWAQMGDLPKLQALLDQLVAMHRLAPGAASLWLTEQGYESNAELGNRPWTEARQAHMNAASEYLAARDPQLASIAQFLLRDTLTYETLTLRARTGRSGAQLPGTWTTGLMREDMTPKTSLSMFRSPIVVRVLAGGASDGASAGAALIEVWGRARPVRTPTDVRIQIASQGGFRVSGAARTDQNGIFDTELAAPTAGQAPTVRFQWLAPNGTWQTSPSTQPLPIPGVS